MNVYKAASRIRLLSPLPSANHPDNWLTVALQSTVCLSECYNEKPDGLTVFLKFSFLLKNHRYGQILAHIDQLKLIPPTGYTWVVLFLMMNTCYRFLGAKIPTWLISPYTPSSEIITSSAEAIP